MTIYRFKIYDNKGNIFNIGRMAAPKAEVEEYCKKQIKEAKRNSNADYSYEVELISSSKPLIIKK